MFVGEGDLRSKSSGTGASKIYHVGRIAELGEDASCALLHTYSTEMVTGNPTRVGMRY